MTSQANKFLLSQVAPVNPAGQAHVNSSPCESQVPPLRQGTAEQGSNTAIKK